jgi:hypothetical protein
MKSRTPYAGSGVFTEATIISHSLSSGYRALPCLSAQRRSGGSPPLSRSRVSVLGGFEYGGGGRTPAVGERDYHYGPTGQGLVALRLMFGDVAILEATHQEFDISDLGSTTPRGTETIGHLNLGLTVRIHGNHALEVQSLLATRDGDYGGMLNRHQTMARLAVFYSFQSDARFGVVDWQRGH